MFRHIAGRWLPTLVLAVSLVGCGTLERKPEPTLANAGSVDASHGAGMQAPADARSAVTSTGANTNSGQGIRPSDPRLKLNLHVFGFSYHPDRAGTRDRHLDNEVNLGLGLNYEIHNDARGVASLEAGFFKDSGSNWAKFAGVGYQFKLGKRWSLGADLLAIDSQTYNNGRGFIAPIPHLTYDFGLVKLNAIYVPRVRERNQFSVFGFYLTLPMGTW